MVACRSVDGHDIRDIGVVADFAGVEDIHQEVALLDSNHFVELKVP